MPITAEQRERLDRLMNERRLTLGITWRDVAVRAGLSYEVLRKLRTGTGGIRDLTGAQISKALEWEPSSVQAIIDGGEPKVIAPPSPDRDDELRPQCVVERAILRMDGISDESKRHIIGLHRDQGHSADCGPDAGDDSSDEARPASLSAAG